MCMSAIYWARIDRVYFGTRLEDTSKIGFDDEFQYIDFRLPWKERKAIQCFPDFERDYALKACEAWQNKSGQASLLKTALRAEYGSGFAWLADGTRVGLSLTAAWTAFGTTEHRRSMNKPAVLISTAKVHPGSEQAFAAWQARHSAAISKFPGFISTDMVPPPYRQTGDSLDHHCQF